MGRMPFTLAAAVAACLATSAAAADRDPCNRACMVGALDAYLAAMIAHDPAKAPIAPNLRSTVNGHEAKTGEGLWQSLTGLGQLQRRYADPTSRQAAYYGLVLEGTEPVLISLRVRFTGNRISESEAIVARKGELLFNAAGAVETPPPPIPRPVGLRPSSRQAMQATVTAYFDALQGGDPKAVPKIDGCERVENGTNVVRRRPGAAAGAAAADEEVRGDCTTGLNTMPISAVAHRRYPVIDTEAGVALGVGLFQRPPGAKWRDGSPRKRNLIHEYFAQDGGKISLIWAVMHYREPADPDGTGW